MESMLSLRQRYMYAPPRFFRAIAPADSLLYQLWSLPSAVVDILIAVAMTLLVRGSPSLTQ